jgi:hypothetical protein
MTVPSSSARAEGHINRLYGNSPRQENEKNFEILMGRVNISPLLEFVLSTVCRRHPDIFHCFHKINFVY